MSITSKAREYIATWRIILKLARRPDEEEYGLLFRLNVLGFMLVGGIGYIIHLAYILVTTP